MRATLCASSDPTPVKVENPGLPKGAATVSTGGKGEQGDDLLKEHKRDSELEELCPHKSTE